MGKTEFDDIIDNLRDNLELLSYAGITDVPALSTSRPSQAKKSPPPPAAGTTRTEAPAEWTYIENPEQTLSSAVVAGPGRKALAFGIWHTGSKICFISGETLTGSTVAPFSGSIGNQLELTVNWVAGELKLPSFSSMTRYLSFGSGPSDPKKIDEAYAEFGARLKKEAEKNNMSIAVIFGHEACGALLGSTDVRKLRGKVHHSGSLLIIPTWGLADLQKDPSMKNKTKRAEAMDDMKIAIAEAGKV